MSETRQQEAQANSGHGGTVLVTSDFRVVSALVRTAFSSEQTLMSWMRTVLSLFTFGFTITQFFYYLEKRGDAELAAGPRRLGIALVGAGIVLLLLAVAEHVQRIRKLKKLGLPPDTQLGLPMGSGVGLFVVGVAALVTILFNWHL